MSVQIKGVGTIGGIDQGLDTVGVVTATSFVGTGVSVVGVVTATSFSGSGANLTNIPAQATIANNADNRVITGGSGVNLNGEANLTFDGTNLDLGDAKKIRLGNSQDLELFHNGSNSGIINSQGALYITNDATNSSDVHIRGKSSIQLHCPADGNVRFQINNSGAFGLNGANYGSSGQVLTSQGSGSAVQWASPASNSPAFQAYLSGHYSPSSGSEVTVPFDTKTGTGFDTNNCYNTSTYKFTPNVAGNYVVYCSFFFQTSGGSNSIKSTYAKIEKNSAINIAQQWIDPNDSSKENRLGHSMTAASTMNGSSDFLIVKAYCLADHTPLLISSGSSFGAFKLA